LPPVEDSCRHPLRSPPISGRHARARCFVRCTDRGQGRAYRWHRLARIARRCSPASEAVCPRRYRWGSHRPPVARL